MMNIEQRVDSLVKLGLYLKETNLLGHDPIIAKATQENPWFSQSNIRLSLEAISQEFLSASAIRNLIDKYRLDDNIKPKTIGLVLAGNIPLVGFHDVLCSYLVGHKTKVKLSDKDKVLLPYFIQIIQQSYPEIEKHIEFVERLSDFDAVIATGSDNTARIFEDYFKHYPHIIRYNRNAVAVLSGDETDELLQLLADDIFAYFGLGCRNVSKLYLPKDYPLEKLFKAFEPYEDIINHHKYRSNYDYNVALYLLNKEPFFQNNFVLLRPSEDIPSRIGTIHYEYYDDKNSLISKLRADSDKIQCIVSNKNLDSLDIVPLGQAQHPQMDTFADGVDTIQFLLSLP